MLIGARTAAWYGDLPAGMVRVKGIIGNGNQYIVTDLSLSDTDSVECDVKVSYVGTNSIGIVGSRSNAYGNNINIGVDDQGFYLDFGNYTNYRLRVKQTTGKRYRLIISSDRRAAYDESGILLGENTTVSTGVTPPYEMEIFNIRGTTFENFQGEMYSLILKDRYTFIPVKKLVSGSYVGGLYDIATKLFLGNNGTGTFGWEEMNGTVVTPT